MEFVSLGMFIMGKMSVIIFHNVILIDALRRNIFSSTSSTT